MKKLLLVFMVLLPMATKAFTGEVIIDGIKYYIVTKGPTAEVRANNYSGDIIIPPTVKYEGIVCNVTSIGSKAFYECKNLTSVNLPNGITSIGSQAFYGCINLNNVQIPNSVKTIDVHAFSYCNSLTCVTIPDGVTKLFTSFRYCKGLTSVILGAGIEKVQGAFDYCTEITDVYCYATKVPSTRYSIDGRSDDYSPLMGAYPEYVTLHVPAASVELYKSTKPWNQFKDVVPLTSITPPNASPVLKCAKPSILYTNGLLSFHSETEGAVCQSTIKDADVNWFHSNEVKLGVTYNISVYASKEGWQNSEVTYATLCWIDVEPKTEGIGNGVTQLRANAVLIQAEDGRIIVNGTDDGTNVSVYSTNGLLNGSTISRNGSATVTTNLQVDSVAIVKIGDKSVKVVVK